MNNTLKIFVLLIVLYIVLAIISGFRFCIGGIRAYFIIGLVPIVASWLAGYWLLKKTTVLSRIVGVLLTVFASLIFLLHVAAKTGLHLMCW